MSHAPHAILAAFALIAASAKGFGADDAHSAETSRENLVVVARPLSLLAQPDVEAAQTATDTEPKPALRAFGEVGSSWITVGLGDAYDFDDALDTSLHVQYSRFFVENVEFGLEGSLWYFDQEGDDAVGLSGSMFFRWHFINEQRYTLFLDAGIGMMIASDNVPDMGTGFNFIPRAGVGATLRVCEHGRFIVGLRWHHISNARIHGEERNPSRDAPMLYMGFMFPL